MSEDKRTTFQLSQDRQVLEARIIACFRDRKTDADYVLTYAELNKLIGADVQHDNNLSCKVTAACRSVSRQLGITLGRDPNRGGIVLIPPGQYVGYIDAKTAHLRRSAKRTATEAHRIASHDGLAPEEKNQVLARGAVAGAIAAFAGKKAVERIERAGDGQPLSLAKTLEAFKKQA